VLRRAFDVVAAGVGLVVLSPLLVVIAALIKLDSPGPVFFRGVRTGLNGVPFRIYKFRTMVVNAERLGGGTTARDDRRVTRMGRFLRPRKLDELPQLMNVLTGDMNLVGPRPELPEYTDRYTGDERLILTVRPGIADNASLEFVQLADVVGKEDADRVYEERVLPRKNALRVEYVRERSFRGDIAIILKTLRKVTLG
jgi:lipopolysaccharide/colanic/teichoic acid biosynthesis glycosyltransferase